MERDKILRSFALLTALGLDGLALFVGHGMDLYHALPGFYWQSFEAGLVCSVALSIGLFALSSPLLIGVILTLRLFVLYVLCLPYQAALFVTYALILGFVLETLLRFRPPIDVPAAASVAIACFVFSRLPKHLSGVTDPATLLGVSFASTIIGAFAVCATGATVWKLKQQVRYNKLQDTRRAELERTLESVIEANLAFQRYAHSAGEAASQQERERITRDIHDTAGYSFTNIIAMVEVAISLGVHEPEKLGEQLSQVKTLAREGLQETRTSLRRLRAADRDTPTAITTLYKVLKTFEEATKIKIMLDFGNSLWSYGNRIDGCVYRVVQESLTNSFRHGQAKTIWITFWDTGRDLVINIEDDGRGSAHVEKGLGLLGIEERVGQLGGSLTITSAERRFHLLIRLPTPGET